jgi:hypothetical protein
LVCVVDTVINSLHLLNLLGFVWYFSLNHINDLGYPNPHFSLEKRSEN